MICRATLLLNAPELRIGLTSIQDAVLIALGCGGVVTSMFGSCGGVITYRYSSKGALHVYSVIGIFYLSGIALYIWSIISILWLDVPSWIASQPETDQKALLNAVIT